MPVPFARSASQTRPTFSRDFAGLKTLDHGVGPAITFTRGSNATYFNAAGTLTTATTNEPRFDHNPSTGASLGLLIEEARTNSIRNSQAGGATNGVIGSGGVMPTNWSITANANGITSEIIGTGIESGLSYIDVKISGTATANNFVYIGFDGNFTAANGQSWTASTYVKLAAGSMSGVNQLIRRIGGRTAAPADVAGQSATTSLSPTSAALATQRQSVAFTFTSASVERVYSDMYLGYLNGSTFNCTLRIAAPQLEQGAFPTSYIPTTTAAATRAADSAVVTPISSFYNQAEGTLFAEATSSVLPATTAVFHIDNNSNNERLIIGRGAGSSLTYAGVTTGGVLVAGQATTLAAGTERIALAYAADNVAFRTSSLTLQEDSSAAVPVSLTHARIGSNGAGAFTTGHIRRIAYWPRRLSNALLQQLTA